MRTPAAAQVANNSTLWYPLSATTSSTQVLASRIHQVLLRLDYALIQGLVVGAIRGVDLGGEHDVRVQIYRVLGLLGQVGRAILDLRDLRTLVGFALFDERARLDELRTYNVLDTDPALLIPASRNTAAWAAGLGAVRPLL